MFCWHLNELQQTVAVLHTPPWLAEPAWVTNYRLRLAVSCSSGASIDNQWSHSGPISRKWRDDKSGDFSSLDQISRVLSGVWTFWATVATGSTSSTSSSTGGFDYFRTALTKLRFVVVGVVKCRNSAAAAAEGEAEVTRCCKLQIKS